MSCFAEILVAGRAIFGAPRGARGFGGNRQRCCSLRGGSRGGAGGGQRNKRPACPQRRVTGARRSARTSISESLVSCVAEFLAARCACFGAGVIITDRRVLRARLTLPFSGGTLERPALATVPADRRAGTGASSRAISLVLTLARALAFALALRLPRLYTIAYFI